MNMIYIYRINEYFYILDGYMSIYIYSLSCCILIAFVLKYESVYLHYYIDYMHWSKLIQHITTIWFMRNRNYPSKIMSLGHWIISHSPREYLALDIVLVLSSNGRKECL